MKPLLLVIALAQAFCQNAPRAADRPAAPVPVPALRPGEKVVFLGDSITWQNLYTAFIEQHFLARYRSASPRFANRGVRGDTAAAAIERLERDVLPLEPDLVLIMLGMNDGGYRGPNRFLLESYLRNLEKLTKQVGEKTGARVVLVTSTCVDPVDSGRERYNRMLASMAAGVVELGRKMRVPVIDLFDFFRAKLNQARALEPPIRLMLDPIHPGPAGHLVIAHYLLTYLDPRPGSLQITTAEHGETISFPMEYARGLVHLSAESHPALRLVPLEEKLDRLVLVVRGWQGDARLLAGDADLGIFTPEELSAGVDLGRLEAAPWSQQARRRYLLLQERWRCEYRLWDPEELGPDALAEVHPLGKGAPQTTREQAREALREAVAGIESLSAPGSGEYRVRIVPAR